MAITKLGSQYTNKFCLGNTQVDRIYLGTNRVYGLPKEYQEVEYIESSGAQWVNTGYVPTLLTKISCKFMPLIATSRGYFGARNDPYRVCNVTFSGGGEMAFAFANGTWPTNRITCTLNQIYDMWTENGKWGCNGVEYTETTITQLSISNYFWLFGISVDGLVECSSQRVYNCKIYNNGVLQRSFIPCYRKSDQVIGLYDCVNDVFYTNQGTGTFIAGPEIHHLPSTYQQVEYVQSSGLSETQWVDTGIKPTIGLKFEIETQATSIRDYSYVFGSYSDDMQFVLYCYYNNGYYFGAHLFQSMSNLVSATNDKTKFALEITNSTTAKAYINNVLGWTANGTFNTNGLNIYLFNLNYDNQPFANRIPQKLYSAKAYSGSTLVRNFVPCYRKLDNKVGLYDTINKVFYTNQGSGVFSKGQDIN